MSFCQSDDGPGIAFAIEATEVRVGSARVATIELTVLDTVKQRRCDMDTLNYCGSRIFVVGDLDAARALHAKLGEQIKSWEALSAAGHVVFK